MGLVIQRSHGSGGNLVAFRSKKESKGNGGGSKGSIGNRKGLPGEIKNCEFGATCFQCTLPNGKCVKG